MSSAYVIMPSGSIERVDSDRTDESPFGSTLATPIDEDIRLFPDIEGKLLAAGIKTLENEGKAETSSLLDGVHVVDVPTRPRSSSLYSQPNGPLSTSDETKNPPTSDEIHAFTSGAPTQVSNDDKGNSNKAVLDSLSHLPFAHEPLDNDISLEFFSLAFIVQTILRVLFFPFWCVLAGGAILLFPDYLEFVVFAPGYIDSPKGIHRFAFWSDMATQLASIFVAGLVVLWYYYQMCGILLAGGAVAQFIWTWQSFRVDQRIALGEDDRQSLYYVWKQYCNGGFFGMKKTESGFYVTDGQDLKL